LRCASKKKLLECFANPFNRFLVLSAVISFLLAKHELFMSPRQPIHFTRGHIWLPLCLLGLPVIAGLWREIASHKRKLALLGAALAFALIVLFDNMVFFWVSCHRPNGIYLSSADRQVFRLLSNRHERPVVVSDDEVLSYLAATYSSARPYLGHASNTPNAKEKRQAVEAFFAGGLIPKDLQNRVFLVITRRHGDKLLADARFEKVASVDGLTVFSRKAGKDPG